LAQGSRTADIAIGDEPIIGTGAMGAAIIAALEHTAR